MNQSKRLFVSFFSILSLFFIFPSISQAEDSAGDFGIKPVFPENQIDKAIGYFDLLVAPDQNQTLEVIISNSSDQERTFEVSVNPAVTSDGGTIDYSQKNPTLDGTLPFDVRDVLIVAKKEVNVPAHAETTVPVEVKIPAKSFKGRVLAGIHVSPKEEAEAENATEGAQIKNRIAYNLAVVLQESQETIEPDLKLLSGDLNEVNAKPTVQLRFQNPQPTIISNLIFTSKIYYENQLYIENTSNAFLVGPNSNFHLNLDLAGDKAKAGDYRAEIIAKSGDSNEWRFTQNFTIKKEKAQKVNENSVFEVQEQSFPWLYVGLVVAVLVLLLILLFLWFHKKKKKGETIR
ncbi:DUF916 and DUF3324 domain-containing protein [Enterococcus faecium]|uniref:DUF916 and DUF3324 domain-containing protein n=1 Tax=Enterococcus TaxID=1350 RepID=UPI0009C0EF74|nr:MULTISPECIES: DUF916 and DUF3324 domain-containing protein [Enterococcus]EGP4969263.1 DUF916 and DUF3324 domain-containing protein [Enterococcus faecium]EGP5048255.1 DUF916 and DUF3324 domain-containing protein [Enterococcus faecium]EGP5456300.1 DUF916 and DUF3324 domain-containing protein [Enterococcus faecium]MBX4241786.1 DUF916 and DUF3324 domain-containing protein [Enterococcus lactis]MBX4246666.1 DUF916 and DUF3324 domain-containing protein [Enterococcus lactis]